MAIILPETFIPNPAVLAAPEGEEYRNDYAAILETIKEYPGTEEDRRAFGLSLFRQLLLDDLFAMLYFVLLGDAPPEVREMANHPFVVARCREVEDGPRDNVIYIWARGHFKSTIITKAQTLQYALANPGSAQLILSYKKGLAAKFLDTMAELCETNGLLRACFPDRIWDDPENESPAWSRANGITFRQHGGRSDPTIAVGGLIEGMPTGAHVDRIVYDDIQTIDHKDTPDPIISKFDNSKKLRSKGQAVHVVVGTIYAHNDALCQVRDKVDIHGRKVYHPSIHPGTDDGTATGTPVFLTQAEFDSYRMDSDFNEQILCDPTPQGAKKFDSSDLILVSHQSIPHADLYRIQLMDQAGDKKTQQRGQDPWAMAVFGIVPGLDELGLHRVIILDALVERMEHDQAITEGADMFMRNGFVRKLGIEKVGLSTTEIHLTNRLKEQNKRHVTLENKRLILLKPKGRNKKFFIEKALQLPFSMGKIEISDRVPEEYRRVLIREMDQHPRGADDFLNICAYLYTDVIPQIPELNRPPSNDQNAGRQPIAVHHGHYGFTAA